MPKKKKKKEWTILRHSQHWA